MLKTRSYILGALIFLVAMTIGKGQSVVKVDPGLRLQTLEGWGASLCWWANMAGDWPEEKVDELCDWIAASTNLNFNIFRFNIGGGDAPDHRHLRRDGGAMPGYRAGTAAPYDWNADAAQRRILLKLKARRPDALFEAFANSPPWWMTKSGCVAGNVDGSNNLKEDCYASFAGYLADVVKHYRDAHGVVFRTIDPMNEPEADWWKAMKNQEGCRFTVDKQIVLVRELHKALSTRGLYPETSISAMDANSMDSCYEALAGRNGYKAAGLFPQITQINTHSYYGSKRDELRTLAAQEHKRLWQSESGPLNVREKGMDSHLLMAQRLITDMKQLQPCAWLDWQIVSRRDPHWGMITADYTSRQYQRARTFYLRMQFSRFMPAGSTVIHSSDSRSLAALNPARDTMVLVLCNAQNETQKFQVDLGLIQTPGSTAMLYRTSETEECKLLSPVPVTNKKALLDAPPKSLSTLLIKIK